MQAATRRSRHFLRPLREKLTHSTPAQNAHEDNRKRDIEHDLKCLNGRHHTRRESLSTSPVHRIHIKDRINISPDCEGHACERGHYDAEPPYGIVAAAEIVYIGYVGAFDQEELGADFAAEQEADADVDCISAEIEG